MIVVGDMVEVHGPNNKNLVGAVVEKRKVGQTFIYRVKIDKMGEFDFNERDINGEVYEWYVVTDLHHHPTPEELDKCQIVRATAARIVKHRKKHPEFRVRLKSGVDNIEETKKLRVVFDPQDAYEYAQLGMHDMGDASLKVEPDPTNTISMRDLLRVKENTNLHSSECQNFHCESNTKGHCNSGSFRSDVNRCPKHTFHTGHFTDEDDETHLAIPGLARNETDQMEE